MRNIDVFIFGLILVCGMTSCSKQSIDPGTDDNAILQSNKDDILSYATTKGLSGTMILSGLYYSLSKPGSSTLGPAYGQEVEFNYKLYVLSRGTSTTVVTDTFVDSTYASKSTYAYLVENNLGLPEGLLRMHEGDQSILLLPSALAFGNQPAYNGKIPANSPVRLDVTLKRARTQDQQINEYMTANMLTPTEVTISGLRFIKTVSNAAGASPTATQTLIVKYKGKLLRSVSAFDSTGTGVYATTIGKNVPGFDEGLAKLKVGEKATIIFPSTIGYGAQGQQIIPPYAPLRFDIELVSVQ